MSTRSAPDGRGCLRAASTRTSWRHDVVPTGEALALHPKSPEPTGRLRVVSQNALAVRVQANEVAQRRVIALLRSPSELGACLRGVLLHAPTVLEEHAEVEGGVRMALLGRFHEPSGCLNVVLHPRVPELVEGT
jgi:hypothetical protein